MVAKRSYRQWFGLILALPQNAAQRQAAHHRQAIDPQQRQMTAKSQQAPLAPHPRRLYLQSPTKLFSKKP